MSMGESQQNTMSAEVEKPRKKWGGAQVGAGRPPGIVPTDEDRRKVEHLAGLGVPLEHIAAVVGPPGGISRDVLTKWFGPEIAQGKAKAAEAISGTLYQRAMAGDTACLIWWSKTQLRWSPAPQEIRIQNDTRVSIVGALEAAQARVIEGEAVERVQRALEGPHEGDGHPEDGDAL
jgi:hypothetical protein